MAKEKEYTIIKTRTRQDGSSCESEFTGTLEQLTQAFSYTLLCGNSWNPKINRHPKTINGLINAINKSYQEKQEYGSFVKLKSKEEK